MKNIACILGLASGVAAGGFLDANPFSAPGNIDNHCNPKQSSGYDFGDLGLGSFSSYGGLNWNQWTCEDSGKRSLDARTSGRKVGGTCHPEPEKCPSFSCTTDDEKFSVSSFFIEVEFEADIEFQYTMSDGSSCKHRNKCSQGGSTINNSQCGGAKNVTIVYPPQPNKPKPSCSVGVHSMSFSCNTASSTKHRTTTTKPASTTSTTEAKTTKTKETKTKTTPTVTVVSSTSATTTVIETTSTHISSFLSTSTVFSTVTSTITSCAPEVTNCPAESVTTTVVTVAVSTTICPVTETHVITHTTTSSAVVTVESSSSISSTLAETTETTSSVSSVEVVSSSTTSSTKPVETLPCPNVVPQCLNTFLFGVACIDNTDTACYCPNVIFVQNIFDCIFAHGETDEIISTAIVFFQGICAPYVPGNPGIATGATVTSYITATATSTVAASAYTTIEVTATTVVPCTNEAGSPIPSSSSTVVVTNTMTVPQVGFTTTSGGVGVIPVTTLTPAPVASATGIASVPATATYTTLSTAQAATGTGSVRPSSSGIVTVNAGGRTSASFGLAGFVVGALVLAF